MGQRRRHLLIKLICHDKGSLVATKNEVLGQQTRVCHEKDYLFRDKEEILHDAKA